MNLYWCPKCLTNETPAKDGRCPLLGCNAILLERRTLAADAQEARTAMRDVRARVHRRPA